MGIFGFLSKAHSDQSLVSGDVSAKIAVYDEKIKTAKENIDANRKALKQMDEAVDQVMARSTSETGADKAVAIRRAQQKERGRLLAEIETYQKTVSSLNEERAPIAAEVRKVEAEVGPIKYIAAMIYGDNPDENTLERSVRWLIILLICVFDPLAVLMLIAANLTQIKSKEWRESKEEHTPMYVADVGEPPTAEEKAAYEADDGSLTEEQINQIKESVDPHPVGWMFDKSSIVKNEPEIEKSILESHPYLMKPFDHFKDTTPIVAKPESKIEEVTHDDMEQSKDATNEVVMPMVSEEPAGTPEDNRQDFNSGLIPQAAMETVGIEVPVKKTRASKKKVDVEQVTEDKSNSASVEDQVNTMIENNDTTGLESIYKQIVKELAKNNRNKSTHWGPLKTKK
jgi:hypothetical protein